MADRRPDFQRTQRTFAAYIRDPDAHPVPPDVSPARMDVYRELFFNNIENFLATGFPVLKSILAGDCWLALVRDFFARHRSRTPLFVEIATEFLDYLRDERGEHPSDPPFLLELAHYEWVELALAVAEAEPPSFQPQPEVDPLDWTVSLSELAWPLAYRYPVHRLGPGLRLPAESAPAPTCLAVYRDFEDTVRFLEINPTTYRWLQILEEVGPVDARQSLLRVAGEINHPEPASVLRFGAAILRDLAERGVIAVGSRGP